MKLLYIFLVSSFAFLFGQDSSTEIDITKLTLEHFQKAKYDSIYTYFDETMKGAMPAEKLEQVWSSLKAQVGKLNKSEGIETSQVQGYNVVYYTCFFEKATLNYKLVFNSEKQISGMFFEPVKK